VFRDVSARRALEVGALPTAHGLLCCPEAARWPTRVGINLRERGTFGGVTVLSADACRLPFDDGSFDLVISASTLEHIPAFWLAAEEMRRVLAPGGTMIVSTPGYGVSRLGNSVRKWAERLRLPDLLRRGTPTMRIHEEPHDYYRFSEFSYAEVILRGLENQEIWSIMSPPRIYGMARKGP